MIRSLLRPLSFIPALLLMYMIFSFSGQTGDVSSQLSYKASVKIVQAGNYIFDANLDEWQIDEWANKINFITRKLAHMTEYFALAIAVSFPLYVYGLHGFFLMIVAGLICVGFACGDEYHQSFVAGRSPSGRDVAIDSVGIFFGILLVRIVGWTGRKTIFRPRKPKVKKIKSKKYRNDYYEDDYDDDYYEKPPKKRKKQQDYYQDTPKARKHPPYYEDAPRNPRQTGYYDNIPKTRNSAPTPDKEHFDWEHYQVPEYNDPLDDQRYDRRYDGPQRRPGYDNDDFSQKPPMKKEAKKKPPKKKDKDWFFDM